MEKKNTFMGWLVGMAMAFLVCPPCGFLLLTLFAWLWWSKVKEEDEKAAKAKAEAEKNKAERGR